MRSLAVRSWTFKPANYEVLDLPVPIISHPDDVLVRVSDAAISISDVLIAAGFWRLFTTIPLPFALGIDFAGTVYAVGSAVTHLEPGDRVYGFHAPGGALSEFLLVPYGRLSAVAKIPPSLSFNDAAALPSVGMTALAAFTRAAETIPGGFQDRTVFVTAGLSGFGSIAIQLAKKVFGAARVITTVSTAKVQMVDELLGERAVDQIVDYTTQDVIKTVGKGTVDFMYDAIGTAMPYLAVMKPKVGVVYSVATVPSGSEKVGFDFPQTPWWVKGILNATDQVYRWRAARHGVSYWHVHALFEREILEELATLIADGKAGAVVCKKVQLNNLEDVKKAYDVVKSGKSGVGRCVVHID